MSAAGSRASRTLLTSPCAAHRPGSMRSSWCSSTSSGPAEQDGSIIWKLAPQDKPWPQDHGASRWATAHLPYLLLCIVCCRGEAIIPRLQQGSALSAAPSRTQSNEPGWDAAEAGGGQERQAVHSCGPRQLSCTQAGTQPPHLDFTDDQQGVGAVARKHVVDVQVVPSKPGTGAVPPQHALPCCSRGRPPSTPGSRAAPGAAAAQQRCCLNGSSSQTAHHMWLLVLAVKQMAARQQPSRQTASTSNIRAQLPGSWSPGLSSELQQLCSPLTFLNMAHMLSM